MVSIGLNENEQSMLEESFQLFLNVSNQTPGQIA